MDVNEDKAAAAKACLEFNPLLNTVFVTGDLSCFATRGNAVNHARGLDDKEIDVFIRSDDEPVQDADQTAEATDDAVTEPDFRLAVVKAAGGGKGKTFVKPAPIPAPVGDAPAQDAAAPAADQTPALDNAAPVTDTPAPAQVDAAIDESPVTAAETPAPAAAGNTFGEEATAKITELVNEVEELLHLKKD